MLLVRLLFLRRQAPSAPPPPPQPIRHQRIAPLPPPRWARILVLLPLLLIPVWVAIALPPGPGEQSDLSWSRYVESIGYHTGLGNQCSYVDAPSKSVRDHLQQHLKAQDHAVESIVVAIEAWEFSRLSGKHRTPLVLAITGPTGTGKTETANLLAESMFTRTKKLKHSEKLVSTGLLVFRGEDFSDNFTNPVSEYHTQIKTRLAAHVHHCSGNAVVVFDEVQKVIPHTLDVLLEAMSERAQLSHYANSASNVIDTSNVIFVFVSDIGVKDMEALLTQYTSRSDIPSSKFASTVKAALDAQWKRLNFGKMIDQVVPFLPFEQVHIAQIIELKLAQLDANYRGIYWHKLWIDPGLADYMSRLDSMQYQVRSVRVNGRKTATKVFAKYGARNIETGPLQFLKSKLLRSIRPFDPAADVRIALTADARRVKIEVCTTPHASEDIESDFAGVQHCEIKWEGAFE